MLIINSNENYFEKFCEYCDYLEDLMDKCEISIKNFIEEEWNPELEFYVECKYTRKLSIIICESDIRKSFEQFIIKPLCEKYDLKIDYIEIVESDLPYIEWVLISNKVKL